MLKLGYTSYMTQGGDWGFFITRAMGLLYPSHCKVGHLNACEAYPPSPISHPYLYLQDKLTTYTPHEQAGVAQTEQHLRKGRGYEIIQNTRPQTLGYALTDSPVGLLGWIHEKMITWTDGYEWTDDEILTWVSIYYFSVAGPTASLRIYYEAQHDSHTDDNRDRVEDASGVSRGDVKPTRRHVDYETLMRWIPHVKYGISQFPKDISVLPDTWASTLGDVVCQWRNDAGGHFASIEKPDVIVNNLREMMGPGGKCEGLIPLQ